MVSFSRCPLGARLLRALLLCLPLCLPGVRGACDSPPRFSFAELSGTVNDSYAIGTQLKYSCRPGYTLDPGKSSSVTCLENSTWSEVPEFCVRKSCRALELLNGRIDVTDLQLGATANFSCDEGYRLIGTTSARCVVVENRVDWDKEVPFCEAIPCPPPPNIANGSHSGLSQDEFSFGSAVTYKCDQGLSLIGEASIHCTTKDNVNGEWSGSAPECKVVQCLEPEVKNGKKQSGFGPDYSYGHTVIFACDDGYLLNGSSTVKCEANNTWVPSLPTCSSVVYTTLTTYLPGGTEDTSGACGSPPRFSFAELSGTVNDSYAIGTQLKYSCRPGYTLDPGKSSSVTCLENSTWSEVPEFCVRKSCRALELLNGRIDVTDLQLGATANFSCDEGYRLIGTTSARCVVVENRVDWDKEVPFCEAIPCPPPPNIANGSHSGLSQDEFSFGSACLEPEVKNGKKQSGFGPDYSYGHTVIFACDDGYLLNGSSTVKCEANNTWVPSLPTCSSIVHTTPTTSLPGGTKDTSGPNTGTTIAIGKMTLILAVLIHLFVRQ